MFQDNPLLAQLKQQMQDTLPKKEGIVKGTDKSFGFLEADHKTRYFIPPPMMKKCLPGDKIRAIIRSENDKESAEPEALLEAGLSRFIARIKRFKGRLQVVPDGAQYKKLAFKAKVSKGVNPEELQDGDWVVAQLEEHPLSDENRNKEMTFSAIITQKITDHDDKLAPWWVTLAKNSLPNTEPEGLTSVDAWVNQDDEALVREDLTHLPFITIDGDSTKDMDDALYAKPLDNGDIELTIAIADPTAYITPTDAMDATARARGFTIYLPGRNIPMLPRELADDLCSLKQDETRLALCCQLTVKPDGELIDDARFFAATICSQARLTYDNVSDWLETQDDSLAKTEQAISNWQPNETIAPVILTLHTMAKSRDNWRSTHAIVFPNRADYHFELSEDSDVIAIHKSINRSANKLVEEAMVTANICAGHALQTSLGYGLFNTHAGFKVDKLAEVIDVVDPTGALGFTTESITELKNFAKLRRHLSQLDSLYLDTRIRRFQSYSEMSHEPLPHFAMGLPIYATWTSPIRKYGDMINHRLLKALILDKPPVQQPDETICNELSLSRRSNNMAERQVSDWLYCRTLVDEVAKKRCYQAEIFDISRAGARVRLLDNGAAAFVPCSQIMANKSRILASKELGTITIDGDEAFKLTDIIEVVLIDVDLDTRNIVAKSTKLFADLPSAEAEADK